MNADERTTATDQRTASIDRPEHAAIFVCPICGEPNSDNMGYGGPHFFWCENGHQWWYTLDRKLVWKVPE